MEDLRGAKILDPKWSNTEVPTTLTHVESDDDGRSESQGANAERHKERIGLLVLEIVANLDTYGGLDYYAVLDVPPTASFAEIKVAYHRALLNSHPDKRPKNGATPSHDLAVDIGLIKRAYTTLSSTESRTKYDASLVRQATGPRPAQVVSLDEFEEVEDGEEKQPYWAYGCRCGGNYRITESDMDKGEHVVGCNSCSEVIWVGYELGEPDEVYDQTP